MPSTRKTRSSPPARSARIRPSKARPSRPPYRATALFSSLQQFSDIILRREQRRHHGPPERCRAHHASGRRATAFRRVYNGKPAGGLGRVPAARRQCARDREGGQSANGDLAKDLPQGVTWDVPYDTTPFITASINDVVKTLVEAIMLVFLVMLIFLQNIRATIIPTLVIPVALLGTFIGLSALHFSLNQLTLFGMVLAIGIVVDDAIVVIENVERIMSEERLSQGGHAQGHGPDHRRDHRDHGGAGRGVRAVGAAAGRDRHHLLAVCADHRGVDGVLGVPGDVLHALAVRDDPASRACMREEERRLPLVQPGIRLGRHYLCRPYRPGRATHAPRWMIVFVALVAVLAGFLYTRLPTSFVPDEDQGFMLAIVNLPSGATLQRTEQVMDEVREQARAQPDRQGHRGRLRSPRASASSAKAKTSAWPSSS